ncbi:hypothetical protein [Methanoregula sp.]|uniref:hypothetical protein n=1 Tax=Methanoregula sp. TaxID=2052170 RepID=UPI0026019AAA|nr:hypothetical protein [Methanoregula sp.]MDD5142873.1 hypothetical protein [Methanoregula sp.]
MIGSKEASFIHTDIDNGKKNKLQLVDTPIHSWYQFVLGYPPHLVKYYLSKFNIHRGNLVLDPFCGTGTTPVECMKCGIANWGIEANNMAYFASTVKTNLALDPSELSDTLGFIVQSANYSFNYHHISDGIAFLTPLESQQDPIIIKEIPRLTEEQEKIIPAGFISEKPLYKVQILKTIIDTIEDNEVRAFFTLSLANLIVKRAGNIGFGPEIYRKKAKVDIDALSYYSVNTDHMIQDIKLFKNGRNISNIVHGDSRDVNSCLNSDLKGKIDCVITSPPYPNEKDYTRSTRLESVLLGFIQNKQELRSMKENLLRSNSRNIFVNDTDGEYVRKFESIEKIADEIEEKRIRMNKTSGFEKQYHKIVRHYFGGMLLHLKTLKPFLSPDAKLAYVVGDQMSFFQTYIPTADLLGEVAESLGYKVSEIELWRTRYATATSRSIDENVIILENQ